MGLTHDGKSPILMENNMNIDKIKTFADGCYSEIKLVSEYMKQRIPLIDGVIKNPSTPYRDDCLKVLFLRANVWIQTLVKLNQPNDFQAICAANRALLEITVDIYLLHHDKTDNSGQMMYWWMQSAKIKSAQTILEYYNKMKISLPKEHQIIQEFYEHNKTDVEKKRIEFWSSKKNPNNPRHPERWTGKSSLIGDVKIVDQYYGSDIKNDLGRSLEEFYSIEYQKLNWYIHSGITGSWGMTSEGFHIICGSAYTYCADFGMLCTKVLLSDFGFIDILDGLRREWDQIKNNRKLAFLKKNPFLVENIRKQMQTIIEE